MVALVRNVTVTPLAQNQLSVMNTVVNANVRKMLSDVDATNVLQHFMVLDKMDAHVSFVTINVWFLSRALNVGYTNSKEIFFSNLIFMSAEKIKTNIQRKNCHSMPCRNDMNQTYKSKMSISRLKIFIHL